MGSLLRSSLLWVIASIAFAAPTHADPLSIETIKKAEKIGIILSDFDPVTNNDIEIAKTAAAREGLNHIVLLPTVRSFRKSLLPYSMRTHMLSAASDGNSTLLTLGQDEISAVYQSEGVDGLTQAILKNNPSIQIQTITSEESGIHDYSLQARRLIAQNPDFYLDPSFQPSQELTRLLDPNVIDLIRKNGYYLGRLVNNVTSLYGLWDRYVKEHLVPIWAREIFRQYRIRKNSKVDRTEITINGKTYLVERHLASGLGADAFIITVDGQKVVAKVPIGTARSIELARAELAIRKWLETHTKIHVPKLLGFDLESGVSIAEFIAGPDVGAYLNDTRSVPKNIDMEFRNLFDEAKALFEKSNLRVDLRSDNLKVRDGQVYLIDLGALQFASQFTTYELMSAEWMQQAKGMDSYCSRLLMRPEK